MIKDGHTPKADNLYLAIQRGRASGDAQLMKVAFEEAVGREPRFDRDGKLVMPGRQPNTAVLLHLMKHRLGQGDTAADTHRLQNSIIFETQIGEDGVIRATEKPLLEAATVDADDDGHESWLM